MRQLRAEKLPALVAFRLSFSRLAVKLRFWCCVRYCPLSGGLASSLPAGREVSLSLSGRGRVIARTVANTDE